MVTFYLRKKYGRQRIGLFRGVRVVVFLCDIHGAKSVFLCCLLFLSRTRTSWFICSATNWECVYLHFSDWMKLSAPGTPGAVIETLLLWLSSECN